MKLKAYIKAHKETIGLILFLFVLMLGYGVAHVIADARGEFRRGYDEGYEIGYNEAEAEFYDSRYQEGFVDGKASVPVNTGKKYTFSDMNKRYKEGLNQGYDNAINNIAREDVTAIYLQGRCEGIDDTYAELLDMSDEERNRLFAELAGENQTTLAELNPDSSSASSSSSVIPVESFSTGGSTSEPRVIPSQETSINPNYITVYITDSGGCYHRGDCHHLKSRQEKKLSEVMGDYAPCKDCRPPYYTGS